MSSTYGWIPILTSEIFVDKIPLGDITNCKQLLRKYPIWMNLSDTWREELKGWWLLRIGRGLHQADLQPVEISLCQECSQPILRLFVSLKNRAGTTLVAGFAYVHGTGLVKYEVTEAKAKLYRLEPQDILHMLVRDALHRHIHHGSDLPLRTVMANDEKHAIRRILNIYQTKIMDYKADVSQGLSSFWNKILIGYSHVFNIYAQARGELAYMKAFCTRFQLLDEAIFRTIETSLDIQGERIHRIESKRDHVEMVFLIAIFGILGYLAAAQLQLGVWPLIGLLLLVPVLRGLMSI